MSKMWFIARHHFVQEVSQRSFLIVLFSLPLFLLLTFGLGYGMARLSEPPAPLGYIDLAGLFQPDGVVQGDGSVILRPFPDRAAAQRALDNGAIGGYYVLKRESAGLTAELVYYTAPPWEPQRAFSDAVRAQLLANQSPSVAERVLQGPFVTIHAVDSGRDYPASGPSPGSLLPAILAMMFAFLVLTTSGYMMEVVVAEKENRTIEIIVTSCSPRQMMAGKIVGAVGIAVIQLGVWLLCLAAAVWVGRQVFDLAWLQTIAVNWREVGLLTLVALPSYVLLAGLMTGLGATLVESQEAQQLGPLLFMLLLAPLYFLLPLINNPQGPLALGLSLFPLTSVMTLGIRSIFAVVPAWHYGLATAVALLGAVGALWLAAKLFRLSMLRYGQRLRLRELFGRRAPATVRVQHE